MFEVAEPSWNFAVETLDYALHIPASKRLAMLLTLLGESEMLWQGWRELYGCREGEVAFQNLL